jgi:hypothetical protein
MQYAEFLKNRCNAVDGTFYDAIKFDKSGSDDRNYSAITAQNIMAHLLLLFIMKSS